MYLYWFLLGHTYCRPGTSAHPIPTCCFKMFRVCYLHALMVRRLPSWLRHTLGTHAKSTHTSPNSSTTSIAAFWWRSAIYWPTIGWLIWDRAQFYGTISNLPNTPHIYSPQQLISCQSHRCTHTGRRMGDRVIQHTCTYRIYSSWRGHR